MLQGLLVTHMVFVLQRRKIASRIVGHSRDNCTSKEVNSELFVRLGQKEGKYNIVKAYTTEESAHIPMAITAAETNEKIPDLHATVLQSANKNEFFSPSIKNLLDTIAETSATANKVPPLVTTAKRALVFGTVPPEIGSNFAEAITPTLLPTNALSVFAPTNLAPGSPLKKQCDNEL
ncbi:uncharacterized protein [Coffea arabica]|uniref:Uncharacterized protein isoform X1 n=1 Tax=Coffea arabica TaxID=13443 RepID=A0ABM4VN43_COFAR